MIEKKKVGNFGERIAEQYLIQKGYKILDRNYFFKIPASPLRGEVDIVAKKENTISFVEVKTLKNPSFLISPEEKVNFSKQRKIIQTAESWLMKNKVPLNSKWQIDVLAIEIKNGQAKISHFENAVSFS